ncbi:MAG: hypothetical protein RSA74_12605 [Chryseobacterium sp.]
MNIDKARNLFVVGLGSSAFRIPKYIFYEELDAIHLLQKIRENLLEQ